MKQAHRKKGTQSNFCGAWQVKLPAYLLLLICVYWIGLLGLSVIKRVVESQNAIFGFHYFSVLAGVLFGTAICLYGSCLILRLSDHRGAKFAMFMTCIPGLSPGVIFGIPFAIWALIVLHDPRVEAMFSASDDSRATDFEKHRVENARVQCKTCRTYFVPTDRKDWTLKGFCSFSCAEQSGIQVSDLDLSRAIADYKLDNITLVCPNGHSFSVSPSFVGCVRPCPVCAERCEVPT